MKAITVKIEGQLVAELSTVKPRRQSVSACVSEMIEDGIRRRKQADPAKSYQAFLAAHPEEREWLDEWDGADLAHPPTPSAR